MGTDDPKLMTARKLEAAGYHEAQAAHDFRNICEAYAEAAASERPRGLILQGPCGTGKTMAGIALSVPGRRYFLGEGRVDAVPGREESLALAEGGWLLDDLGREPVRNEYGIRTDAFPMFIQLQYRQRAWKRPPIITTNYSVRELVERYDGHTVSRLSELFIIVQLQAEDHRKKAFRIYR